MFVWGGVVLSCSFLFQQDALRTALESQLFRDDDYLVEDARDLIERVDERFARQRAKEAYAALKVGCLV